MKTALDPDLYYTLPLRLGKFVGMHAKMSRRQVWRAWKEDRIELLVAGSSHRVQPGIQDYVFPGEDQIFLDGQPLDVVRASGYYVLNKPMDVITTTSDPQGRRCLTPWLEQLPEGVFPVGRLDRQTTGALFLTDHGELMHQLLHPEFHVEKMYELTVSTRRGGVDEGLKILEQGVDIQDGKGVAKAVSMTVLEQTVEDKERGQIRVHLVLNEGRNRQVRKMCKFSNLYLDHLHRVTFGPLGVTGMTDGEVRELTSDEVNEVWQAVGGVHQPFLRGLELLRASVARYQEENDPNPRLEQWISRFE